MTVINKWLLISENCDDLNRCKPYREKHDEHATYMTTFHWLSRSQKRPLHPKEVLTIKDRLTQPSSWVVSFFLPCDSPVVGERGFSPMVTQLHQLTGSISLACDRYVQYLLTGPTYRPLTDIGGGYNLEGAGLPYTHSLTFPTSCLYFPLMAPPGL
jgi:hypothetical protein